MVLTPGRPARGKGFAGARFKVLKKRFRFRLIRDLNLNAGRSPASNLRFRSLTLAFGFYSTPLSGARFLSGTLAALDPFRLRRSDGPKRVGF